jgi:hypothetical protein
MFRISESEWPQHDGNQKYSVLIDSWRRVLSCPPGRFTIRFSIRHYIFNKRGEKMKNPLDSIPGTIVSGLILTVVLYFFLKNFILAGV